MAHIRQQSTGECLAACAAMVLNYLGHFVDYQRLIKLLRIQRTVGTPFFHIHELKKLGISVTHQQGTLQQLHTHLTRRSPCITGVQTSQLPYWNHISTPHAVVVVGMDSQFVYVNDPEFATAPIQVDLGDFDLAWLEHDEFYALLTL
ncbi:MAG: peptidase C39 family protein [Chloroflexota bacterium]|nr:peptidase C39 family protein [Chloroflexota bacterium]